MKNIRYLLIIFLILSILATVIAASLTVVSDKSGLKSTFYSIALCIYTIMVILAIFDIVKSHIFTGREKLLWVMIVLFGNAMGVIVYIFNGKKGVANN